MPSRLTRDQDFDGEWFKTKLIEFFAWRADPPIIVAPANVTLAIAAASITVAATVSLPDESTASAAVEALQTYTTDDLAWELGVTLEADPRVAAQAVGYTPFAALDGLGNTNGNETLGNGTLVDAGADGQMTGTPPPAGCVNTEISQACAEALHAWAVERLSLQGVVGLSILGGMAIGFFICFLCIWMYCCRKHRRWCPCLVNPFRRKTIPPPPPSAFSPDSLADYEMASTSTTSARVSESPAAYAKPNPPSPKRRPPPPQPKAKPPPPPDGNQFGVLWATPASGGSNYSEDAEDAVRVSSRCSSHPKPPPPPGAPPGALPPPPPGPGALPPPPPEPPQYADYSAPQEYSDYSDNYAGNYDTNDEYGALPPPPPEPAPNDHLTSARPPPPPPPPGGIFGLGAPPPPPLGAGLFAPPPPPPVDAEAVPFHHYT